MRQPNFITKKVPAVWLGRGESYDGLKDRLFGTGSLQSFVDEHNEPLLKEAERVDKEDARRARQEGRQTRAWLSPPPPPCDDDGGGGGRSQEEETGTPLRNTPPDDDTLRLHLLYMLYTYYILQN